MSAIHHILDLVRSDAKPVVDVPRLDPVSLWNRVLEWMSSPARLQPARARVVLHRHHLAMCRPEQPEVSL